MKPQPVAHTWLKLETGSHTDPVVALAVAGDRRTVVSAADCTLRVWDAAERKPLRQLLGHTGPRVEGGDFADTIDALALSPDGRWAVTIKSARRVEVFDLQTGNLAAAFEHGASPGSLAFSADGRWLAIAGTRRHGPLHNRGWVEVIATRALVGAGFDTPPRPAARRQIVQTRMVDEVMHLVLCLRWIPVPLREVPELARRRLRSRRRDAAALGLVVAVTSYSDATAAALHWLRFVPGHGLSPLFSLRPAEEIGAGTLAVSAGGVVVATPDPDNTADEERPRSLLIALDHAGSAMGRIVLEQPPVACAFSPDGRSLAVGLAGDPVEPERQPALVNALAFGPHGLELRSTYYGHDRMVMALAWLDEDTVLSAGGDNHAIHLWSPRTRVGQLQGALRGTGQALLDVGIDDAGRVSFGTVPARLLPVTHARRQQRFDLASLHLDTVSCSEPDPAERDNQRWTVGDSNRPVVQIYHVPDTEGWQIQLMRPGHLSLAVGTDDTWVLWTRSGYYATNAPQGKARFGYCVDRGPRREALFLPADRFAFFDRADIVRAVVEHGSEERARAAGVAIPEIDVASLLPPLLEVDAIAVAADRRTVRVDFRAEAMSSEWPTTRLWILRNERFIWAEADAAKLRRRRWSVTLRLDPGRNAIRLHGECGVAVSVPCSFEVRGPDAVRLEAATGRLFLLAVGVSDFAIAGTPQAGDTKPLKFPHRDATAIYNALAGSRRSARLDPKMPLRNGAFDGVEAKLLVNEQATKAAILEAVQGFAATIVEREQAAGDERDVLFVFLSGHGTRFKGESDLFFWNWDLVNSAEDMERTGLSLVELARIAGAVPAEVVLVIDACHSGMAGNNLLRGLDPEEVARRIRAVHERGLYVINASRSEEFSWEHDGLRHGLLTAALLQALNEPRWASGPERSVGVLALAAAVQEIVPRLGRQLGIEPQTPVCRLDGDLLPLTIYRPPARGRASPRLPPRGASPSVPARGDSAQRGRDDAMVTKTTAAKKAAQAAPAANAPAKKAPAKTATAPKAAAKKAPATKAPAQKSAAAKAPAAKPAAPAAAKKSAPAKPAAKKTAVKTVAAKKRAAGSGAAPKPSADVVRRP